MRPLRLLLSPGVLTLVLLGGLWTGCRDRTAGASAAPPTVPAKIPPDLDVVLITLDTLRADAPGFAGNTRVETPVLDRLARGGRVYTNAHAHNVVTLPSHANILTGLLPYQHGIRDNTGFELPSGTPTLASLLKAKGYATGAFVGAFPLDSRFGLDAGFDVYDDRYRRGKTRLDFEMPERPGTEVVAAARTWWDRNAGRKRFLWVHLYDCHAPYRPPPPFDARYRAEPYLGEVAATDAALAPLLEPFLSGSARALVIVTSDHGEALGDHGEQTHGLFAYEATLRVPLVLWLPGVVAPGVSADPVRHADIPPTVLAATGLARPASWTGSSLFQTRPAADPSGAYFESFSAAYNRGWAPLRGVIAEGHKYIDLPLRELYDLRGDPAERRDLSAARPEVLRRLARELPPEWEIRASERSRPEGETARRLRSLGYLSGNAPLKRSYTAADDPKKLVPVDRELHLCVDLYQRGDLPGAVALARRIVAERPGMSIAYSNLGFLLRQAEALPEALRVYAEAVRSGVADEELRTNYALALSEAGRASEAVPLIEPVAGAGGSAGAWNALGIAYSDSGRPAQALRAFDRALLLDPEDVEAMENRGIVHLRAGNLAAARDSFRKALAIDDELPRAWNGLGVAVARLGDEREAIRAWTRAIALDPRLYDALFNLGLTAGKHGLRQESRQALERFVATAPRRAYAADLKTARRLLRSLEGPGS